MIGYPAETTEAFCDGHVQAFAFFGGVPEIDSEDDNTKIAVARILGDGKRQRTRVFTELAITLPVRGSVRPRPGKGNDKGKVEGLVGYARRNFLVPIPVFDELRSVERPSIECCRRRMADCLRGHDGTIGERLGRDFAAFQTPLPAPYDACEKIGTTVSSLSLVRYRLNDYSVPTTYGHRDVLVRGYVHEVVISCGAPNSTSFTYSGGAWNAAYRQFRGFSFVSLLEHGDGSVQDRVDKKWYHQGSSPAPIPDDPNDPAGIFVGQLWKEELSDSEGVSINRVVTGYSLPTAPDTIVLPSRKDYWNCKPANVCAQWSWTAEYDSYGSQTKSTDLSGAGVQVKVVRRTFAM